MTDCCATAAAARARALSGGRGELRAHAASREWPHARRLRGAAPATESQTALRNVHGPPECA
eukprot:3127995-Pleurochrysis_carterae.AAC.2